MIEKGPKIVVFSIFHFYRLFFEISILRPPGVAKWPFFMKSRFWSKTLFWQLSETDKNSTIRKCAVLVRYRITSALYGIWFFVLRVTAFFYEAYFCPKIDEKTPGMNSVLVQHLSSISQNWNFRKTDLGTSLPTMCRQPRCYFQSLA